MSTFIFLLLGIIGVFIGIVQLCLLNTECDMRWRRLERRVLVEPETSFLGVFFTFHVKNTPINDLLCSMINAPRGELSALVHSRCVL